MFGGIDRAFEEFDFAFSTGCTSAARGIDMDSCFHGCLQEVLLVIHQNLSFTGKKNYMMFWHYEIIVTQPRLDFDRGGAEKWL
jgi:hypothetical protein